MQRRADGKRTRIGPWRLLDMVQATMPWRASLLIGAPILPEYGPPDAPHVAADPDSELPESNIGGHEQQAAVQRERARRFVRTRRGETRSRS